MSEVSDLSGVWNLDIDESTFGFLPPPESRVDSIVHREPHLRVETRQMDANGAATVVRELVIDGPEIEILIYGRSRRVRARRDGAAVVIETRSEVSGKPRRIEDRLTLDAKTDLLLIERRHEQPGGAVHQRLRFVRHGAI